MSETDISATDPDVRPSEVTTDRVGLEPDAEEGTEPSTDAEDNEDEDEEDSGDEAGTE